MTLSTRNRILIAAFVASLPPLVFLALSAPVLYRAPAEIANGASQRSSGLSQFLTQSFLNPAQSASLTGIYLCVILAAASLIALYYSFEKTQAPEILFIAFFAFSFAFEALRATIPLSLLTKWPKPLLAGGARFLIFARILGLFSLFTASIYSGGLTFQKYGRILLILVITALLIANSLPLDDLAYDTAFLLVPGYNTMLLFVELACILMAGASFVVAAYSRNSKDFLTAAIGCLIATLGRDALIRADSWPIVIFGCVTLVGGSWLMTASIHRHYLWL